MDSEMSDFCFSCWNRAHVSRPVREPRDSPIVGRNSLDFNFFCVAVLASIFSLKIAILEENWPKMDPTWPLLEAVFWKQCENGKVCLDCAGVYGLHMSPSCGALRATQKSKKKGTYFRTTVFTEKIRKCTKTELQKVSEWVRRYPGNLTLAALGALLVPQPVFYTKNEPTSPQKCPREPKITPILIPQVHKSDSKSAPESEFIGDSYIEPQNWISGPADCAERLE